jgi:hypothetical protein
MKTEDKEIKFFLEKNFQILRRSSDRLIEFIVKMIDWISKKIKWTTIERIVKKEITQNRDLSVKNSV